MELSLIRSLMDREFYDEHRVLNALIDCSAKMIVRLSKP